MLPCKIFIILHFIFRPMVHFEFIFVKSVRSVSRHLCVCLCVCVNAHLFQYHFVKKLSLLHCFTSALLLKINSLYLHGYISGFSVLFIGLLVYFFHQHHIALITVAF